MPQRRLAVAAMGGRKGVATAISPSHRRRRGGDGGVAVATVGNPPIRAGGAGRGG